MGYHTEREDNKEKIIDVIGGHERIGFTSIVEKVDMSEPTVSKILKKLVGEEKIKKVKDKEDKRKKSYYLPKDEIERPENQAKYVSKLILDVVGDSLERKQVYEKLKQKKDSYLFEKFKHLDEVIIDIKKIEDVKKKFVDRFEKYEDVEVNRLRGMIRIRDRSLNFDVSDIEGESKKELIRHLKIIDFIEWNFFQEGDSSYDSRKVDVGLLLRPKMLTALKFTINHLFDRTIKCEDLGKRKMLEKTITHITEEIKGSYCKAEKISSKEEDKIKEGIEEILEKSPEQRQLEAIASESRDRASTVGTIEVGKLAFRLDKEKYDSFLEEGKINEELREVFQKEGYDVPEYAILSDELDAILSDELQGWSIKLEGWSIKVGREKIYALVDAESDIEVYHFESD